MTLLRQTFFIYLRNLKTWTAQPATLLTAIASSAFMFIFFGAPLGKLTLLPGFPAESYQAYLTGMVLVMTVVFSGSDMAMVLLTDILSGYFDKLLLSPVNRLSILLGTLAIGATRALAQVVVIILIALAFGVRFEAGILGVLAIVVATTAFGVAMSCIGLLLALRTKSVQVTMNSWLLFMPLAFLTTGFMPRELLSGWFEIAVRFNPVDYVMSAVRAVIIEGWVWSTILPGVWVLVGMTAILLSLTTWQYRQVTA